MSWLTGTRAQVRERGVAGAEVVELDLHAVAVEVHESFPRHGGTVAEEHALRHLDRETAARQRQLVQPLENPLRELAVGKVRLADVEADRDRVEAKIAPGGDIGGHRLQHPLADAPRDHAILQGRCERCRGKDLVIVGADARERLKAGALAGVEADLGLVEGDEPPLGEGRACELDGARVPLKERVQLARVELNGSAVGILRRVQRQIGLLHELRRGHRVVGDARDAERAADIDVHRADMDGSLEAAENLLRLPIEHRTRLLAHREDCEFIAAETRDYVAGLRRLREPAADLGEDLVSDRVTARVVDLLEVVEIEHEQRYAGARLGNLRYLGIEHAVEVAPVCQARQLVEVCSAATAARTHSARA